MAKKRPHFAASVLLGCLLWAHGCGINLSDELAGRPCKDNRCLPGYVCTAANVCMRVTGSGGEAGADASVEAAAGSAGTGTDGEGGSVGSDANPDVPVIPDASIDSADVSTGGSAGSAGSAGTAGSLGSGGSAGTAGNDGGANPWPGTGCRQLTCGASAICCVASYPGYPNLPPAIAFSCEAPTTTEPCQFTLRCDGDHDCPRGQQCCAYQTAGGWLASCESTCAAPRYRVECTKPQHCGNGLECCGRWDFTFNRFSSITCSASCNGFNDRAFCAMGDQCSGALTCRESASLPGFQVCQ